MRTLNYDETVRALQGAIDRECENTTARLNAMGEVARAAEKQAGAPSLDGTIEIEKRNAIVVLAGILQPLYEHGLHLMTPIERVQFIEAQLVSGVAGVKDPAGGYITTPQVQLELIKGFVRLMVADSLHAVKEMEAAGIKVYWPDDASPENPVGRAFLIITPKGTCAVKATRGALMIYMRWLNRATLLASAELAYLRSPELGDESPQAEIVTEWCKLESHIQLYKAKLFVLDNELLDAIEDTVVYPSDETLELPFPSTWVEVAHRGKCDYSGWLFCKQPLMMRRILYDHTGMLKYRKPPYPTSLDTLMADESVWYADANYAGYENNGIVVTNESADDLYTATRTKLPLRIIKYLTSKNITYEMQTRAYKGSSKAKKKQPPKSYRVTEVRKEYVARLREQVATGTGRKLDHRIDVPRHRVRYRYCPNCEKRRIIKECLKLEPCKECGTVADLDNAKIVVKWRGPFPKGPDIDDQVIRRIYRLR